MESKQHSGEVLSGDMGDGESQIGESDLKSVEHSRREEDHCSDGSTSDSCQSEIFVLPGGAFF